MNKALNEQIGHELGAGLQYVSIAAHFSQRQLTLLAKLFLKQSEEERQHALKFVKYVLDTKGELHIPAIAAPTPTFASAEDAVEAALNWENDVTRQITALMDLAMKENDYLAQGFLQWFIDEQLEEMVKMERLLSVIRQSGEKNLLMVEAYLVHIEKAGLTGTGPRRDGLQHRRRSVRQRSTRLRIAGASCGAPPFRVRRVSVDTRAGVCARVHGRDRIFERRDSPIPRNPPSPFAI